MPSSDNGKITQPFSQQLRVIFNFSIQFQVAISIFFLCVKRNQIPIIIREIKNQSVREF